MKKVKANLVRLAFKQIIQLRPYGAASNLTGLDEDDSLSGPYGAG